MMKTEPRSCNGTRIIALGSCSALISVALGAFAAHGLTSILSPYLLSVFKTGIQYQAWHSFALLVCGVLLLVSTNVPTLETKQKARKGLIYAAICFIIGILCFSGSLYLLALTGTKWLGPITPIGGVFFMLGWALLAISALRFNKV